MNIDLKRFYVIIAYGSFAESAEKPPQGDVA
jgi:hypothetical protein